jgi:hypothetical protein
MRFVAYALFVAGAALGQNMTDFAAAAVGGTVGGASGKKVSDGITAVLGKVGEQSVKAAGKEETASPALKLGPGTPKADAGGVPPPPPPSGRRSPMAPPNMSALAQVSIPPEVTRIFTLADVAPVLPPPPEMSPEDLKTVTTGMSRAQILKFGAPASKITMYEDGHVLEIYSYREKGQRFGTVRLNNGTVASVEQP